MKKLRIATLNVCTLKGVKRHQRLFDILQEQQVDICALQETRITDYAYPSFVQMAKRRGYSCNASQFYNPAKGGRQCDCLTLSKVPMQRLKDSHEGARRMVLSAIHRDGMQPLLLANLHGDGSCKASIRAQMCHALETARRNARTLVVIGDFNLTPEEGAVSEALAKGWLELPETQQERQQATRTHGRHIDYMLISRGEGVTERKQIEGVADHDMVMYDLAVGDAHRRFGCQARSHITRREAEVTKDEWDSTGVRMPICSTTEKVRETQVVCGIVSQMPQKFFCRRRDPRDCPGVANPGSRRSLVPGVAS